MDISFLKSYVVPSVILFGVVLVLSIIMLMIINTSLMRIPIQNMSKFQKNAQAGAHDEGVANPDNKYSAISDRNLFRTKLQIELPKPKTEKEIEEENFYNTLHVFGLKGVWIGDKKEDNFAFIDKGPQKGVWIHRNGEIMEGGLILTEIKPNSVLITKGEFGATLTLFTKGFERAEFKRTSEKHQKTSGKDKKSK